MLEKSFSQFLRQLCQAEEQSGIQMIQAQVTERRIDVQQHNTWRKISAAAVSLDLDANSLRAHGSLKIANALMHPQVGLLFSLIYKVAFKDRNNAE